MERTLTPEILDALPSHDDRARRSRRDLRRINRCMGNNRWWRRHVAPAIRPGERVLEIGAGCGQMRSLLHPHAVDGLDLHPAPAAWPASARWHRVDVDAFDGWCEYDAVVGNLFFHHLSEPQLRRLGARLTPHVRVIAACEPQRARRFHFGFQLLARLIGASDVTLHDGRVSIDAGFRGDELCRLLGLDRKRWHCTLEESRRGACRMIAVRRER